MKHSKDPVYASLMLHRGKHMESIWVRKGRGKLCEVLAIPFYGYNISLGDIVSCSTDEDGEGLFIDKVVKKSGNRTVRVAFKAPEGGKHPEANKLVKYLKENGLKWDYNGVRVFSINVPSEDAYKGLIARLNRIPKSAQMMWEDGDPQPERTMDGEIVAKTKD
jgi:Domain of unknown function (DUF4265)